MLLKIWSPLTFKKPSAFEASHDGGVHCATEQQRPGYPVRQVGAIGTKNSNVARTQLMQPREVPPCNLEPCRQLLIPPLKIQYFLQSGMSPRQDQRCFRDSSYPKHKAELPTLMTTDIRSICYPNINTSRETSSQNHPWLQSVLSVTRSAV